VRARRLLCGGLLALCAAGARADEKPASSWLPSKPAAADAGTAAAPAAPLAAPAKAAGTATPPTAPAKAASPAAAPATAPGASPAAAPAASPSPGAAKESRAAKQPPAAKPAPAAAAPAKPAATPAAGTAPAPGAAAAPPSAPAAAGSAAAKPASDKPAEKPAVDNAPVTKKPDTEGANIAAALSTSSDEEAAKKPRSSQELYDDALSAHAKGDARKAAALFQSWLRTQARTADGYDTAQHLLSIDLAKLGLLHAALTIEALVVQDRTRPELVPEALANLEKWTRDTPHDETRLEEELLHGTDFGNVEGPAKAFVLYQQGALDLKLGSDRWSQARFAELPEGSGWRARAKLLTAASKLARGGPDASAQLVAFEAIAADDEAPRDVKNDAHIEAARLQFEAGKFDVALTHYTAVDLPELDAGRGQLYLEEAWTRYRLGDGSRAMGLLAALDAPSFRALFLPEKFQLRALIFKDACHWLAAKRAARGLLRRYRPALEAIRERQDLTQVPLIAEAALQKGAGARAERFLAQLIKERDQLVRYAGSWSESGLQQRLASIYSLALSEAQRRRQLELEKGALRVADELLGAVEQVNLVDYEVGLALYRRQRASQSSGLLFADAMPKEGEVGFEFDGEYWNDELQNLRFALADRCTSGVAP
jgi:hypothetical protein